MQTARRALRSGSTHRGALRAKFLQREESAGAGSTRARVHLPAVAQLAHVGCGEPKQLLGSHRRSLGNLDASPQRPGPHCLWLGHAGGGGGRRRGAGFGLVRAGGSEGPSAGAARRGRGRCAGGSWRVLCVCVCAAGHVMGGGGGVQGAHARGALARAADRQCCEPARTCARHAANGLVRRCQCHGGVCKVDTGHTRAYAMRTTPRNRFGNEAAGELRAVWNLV